MRPLWDMAREGLVIAILSLLYIPAWRHRSLVIFIIATGALVQHVLPLIPPQHADGFLTTPQVKLGALVLGLAGAFHRDRWVLFAGTYSYLSKFDWLAMVVRTTPAPSGVWRELTKLLVAGVVFVAVARMLVLYDDRRLKRGQPQKTTVVAWFPGDDVRLTVYEGGGDG